MPRKLLLTTILLCAAGLSACESLPYRTGGVGADDYALGSTLTTQMGGGDVRALQTAFLEAMSSDARTPWRGGRARGAVTPGGWALGNLREDPDEVVSAARTDLDIANAFETDLGLYVMTRNTNVRTGPGTSNKIAEVIPSGSGVEVIGKVVNAPWYLIAMNGEARGFVHESLALKAPGTELELAGGPRRQARLCRRYSQWMLIGVVRDEWDGVACKTESGWRIIPPKEDPTLYAPVYLTD